MKKLTRVKLINWHRFTNTIIDFENSTLISGENGAGKSTLLDAIQFVLKDNTVINTVIFKRRVRYELGPSCRGSIQTEKV